LNKAAFEEKRRLSASVIVGYFLGKSYIKCEHIAFCVIKMKKQMLILTTLFISVLFLCRTQPLTVKANATIDETVSESIMISVDCTNANVSCQNIIMSYNETLVHFPSGVNLADPTLEDVIVITLTFSTSISILIFEFNNTDEGTAVSIANSKLASIETAFDTDFTFVSSGPSGTYVNVTYSGLGKSDLAIYANWLRPQCLKSDLEGFSSALAPMAQETNSIFSIFAEKESGTFDWGYSMMAAYFASIPTGSGSHTIDVLDLLNVGSLAPSPYAAMAGGGYASTVMLLITSSTPISYVSCQPGESVGGSRGWIYYSFIPTVITVMFTFANDPSPASSLSVTFSGIVIPEFASMVLVIAFMIASATALAFRKRTYKH